MSAVERRLLYPRFKFGRGILSRESKKWGNYLLVTMPAVWANARKMLAESPAHILYVKSMEHELITGIERELPEADTIVGMGGGMAIDLAKFIAWKRGMDPVLVPSAASVDAPVCSAIAVREAHKVKYIGKTAAKVIIVDYQLVQSAPPPVNRAGIGDLLSIHTALFDWDLAVRRGQAKASPKIRAGAAALIDQLEEISGEISRVSEKAVRWLLESFARENRLCIRFGSSRPEEGSEHFFAYNVERLTGRSFVHGELVCLGVVLLSRLQENNVERVLSILKRSRVRFHPAQLGLTRKEVWQALLSLKHFAEQEKLVYSVINEREISPRLAARLCKGLKF
jgi:glycerol dehydrogenase-like iron-containing ADH family enzyme